MASHALPPEGGPPPRQVVTLPAVAAAILLAALLFAPVLLPRPDAPERRSPAASASPSPSPAAGEDAAGAPATLAAATASAGWQEEVPYLLEVLEELMAGRQPADAYATGRAEAVRRDLALFPPGPAELERLLRGGIRERTLALVAAAAHHPEEDDLIELALGTLEPSDPRVLRLLGAELAAALPAERLSGHEDALVHAFEAEPDPLVLAVALPALERLDASRLSRILRTQLVRATPEMRPVLLRLAASRVGADALRELEAATPGLVDAPP
jgi:hypothetical protein